MIIQWRATCKLATLWQRFGRAVRSKELTGTALLLAEKDHFDDEQATKAARKAQRVKTRKRKAKDARLPSSLHPVKRVTTSSPNEHVRLSEVSEVRVSHNGENADSNDSSSSDELDDEGELTRTEGSYSRATGSGIEGLLDALKNRDQGGGKDKRRTKQELDPGVDYLINANRHAGLMCRRKVFDVCFDNAAAGGLSLFPIELYSSFLVHHHRHRLSRVQHHQLTRLCPLSCHAAARLL